MDIFVKQSAEILLGKKLSMNLLDSLVELRKEIDEIDFEYILNRSQNEEWEVAAKISQAVVVRTYGGDAWSKLIRKEIFTSKFGATPFFLAGLVLGSFRAAIWLDENCPTRTSFSDRFPRIIEEFIICQTEVTKITGATISNPKYASELSTLVKKWAGGNPDKSAPASWCSQGIRLGEIGNIFVHVQATIEDAMFGKLSPIGQEVLNQLNYAAFSLLSVEGRSAAMEYMLSGSHTNRISERLAKRARGATPMR